jgi:O-antigen/teichoic acid export membrane protein
MVFRRLAKDSAVYGGADFLTKFLSFFSFPLIAAALSPAAFGALELIVTGTALLGMVANCGINNAVQRFYWDKDTTVAMQPTIVTSGLYAQVAFSLLAVTLGLVTTPLLMPLIEQAAWPITWVALVSALLLMALSQWAQYALDVIRLHFAPWQFLALSLASRIVSIGFGLVAVVFLGLGIDGLLSAQVLVLIFIVPLALWMIRRDFQPSSFDRKWFIELVQFGHPFIYAGLAFWLFGSMDRWMLASMASVEEVGIYSVAFRFASLVFFVSSAFGQAWSPVAIKIRADHPDQYRKLYGQVLLLLLFTMLVVGGGVALFAGEIISLIMPSQYLASALPLAILCFGIVLQSTQQVTAVGISMEKKTYLFARLAWLSAIVNFVLNWLLIPSLGAAGCAWATLVSYVVLTTSYLYFTQRLHPLQLDWTRLISLMGLGLVVGVVSVVYINTNVNYNVIIIKLGIASVCLFFGWQLLPVKTFKTNPM